VILDISGDWRSGRLRQRIYLSSAEQQFDSGERLRSEWHPAGLAAGAGGIPRASGSSGTRWRGGRTSGERQPRLRDRPAGVWQNAATIPDAERNVAQCRWRIEQAAGAVLVETALGLPDEFAAADRPAGRTKAAAVDYAEMLCRIAATSMGKVLHARYFASDLTAFSGIAMGWSAKIGAQPHPFVCIPTPPAMPAQECCSSPISELSFSNTRLPGNSVLRHLIPTWLIADLFEPGIGAQRSNASGLAEQPIPGVTAGVDDLAGRLEDAVREAIVSEMPASPHCSLQSTGGLGDGGSTQWISGGD
jgi:hypothetical protein